ncbi:MAG: NUDIX domain-containing protein [Anaerolineae bacterium]|nr:NUDIX domain-containing protein [Anaerolineae bacterium]
MACSPGTFIVPINEAGEVLMTIELAATDNQPILMLPGGAVEPDEDPAESANRELQEEIGYKGGRLDFLAELHIGRKYSTWMARVYLARDLVPSRLQGDEEYEITVERVPLADFEHLIDSGRLTDGSIIAALYLARRHVNAGK